MTKPTIQLSLAVSSREEEARKEAAEATYKLRKAGHVVYNPFEMCADIDRESVSEQKYWWMCVKRCCDNLAEDSVDILVEPKECVIYSIGQHIEFLLADKFGISTICHDGAAGRCFGYARVNEEPLQQIAAIISGDEHA